MERLRIGIIGLGIQGSLYAGILSGKLGPMTLPKPERVELTAVSTRSKEALKKLPEGAAPQYFADWREMLRSDSCDAVVVTVPHFQHPEIAIFALEQGKHVLCEKPAGIRANEVRAMLEAEKKSSASLAMMFNNRARPVYERCHELDVSGELGVLRHVNWTINTFWRPDTYYKDNVWRGTWQGEGGGMLVNQLAHQLDMLLWLCGEPASLVSVLRNGRYRDIRVENEIIASLSLAGGATGELIANGYDPFGLDRLELSFSKGKLILEDGARLRILRYRQDEAEWNRGLNFQAMSHIKSTSRERLVEEGRTHCLKFYVTDPDGNKIEMMQLRPDSMQTIHDHD